MSNFNPGLLAAYNSLTDKHLTGYFNNAKIRRHLQKVGLITQSGQIVPDKEYKHKLIQRAHQRHVRECLAQAIFHKVLDMERLHQTEIKRKLEEFARKERIHKKKVERSKRYDDEPLLMLSPRPPTGPKISPARHSGPEGENSESTESPGSSRPNTAPGKMQRPVRLKPLNSNSATASQKRTFPGYRHQDRDSSNDTDQPLSYTLDRDTKRRLTITDFSSTVLPYHLPVINNYLTPVPPLTKKKERGPKPNGTLRGRKLRPTTAPTASTEPSTLQRTSAQSKVSVRIMYFGKSVHLSHDLMDLRDEVKVFQQHCGGENLCVYKGKLKEGEILQFVSRRHLGFPFSLTFFLNGLQVDRLSSCCEFKHRKGARLGGRHGHFGFCGVEGASPCYKCIIAMGLDKKPTPPPKRVKEELPTSKSPNAKEATDEDEHIDTHSNVEPDAPEEMETEPNGEIAGQKKSRDEYEEDFEADDEGQVEDGDEVEEKPSSAVSDGEKERETRDENENDVNEKHIESDSEAEDANMSSEYLKEVRRSSSVSSGQTSSLSSSDNENSEREIEEETKKVTSANVPEEHIHADPEEVLPTAQTTAETKMEMTDITESSSVTLPQAAEEDSGTQDGQGDGMEKSDLEMSEDTEKTEGTEGEEAGEEAKPEDKPQETEPERAKSMQGKLTEAILKESQCSSEPELSDTCTEEDEGASVKTQKDSQGAETKSAVGFTSPQLLNTNEDISKETEVNTQEAACEETAHGDVKTGQPAEETNRQEPYDQKEEEREEIEENQETKASLDMEEKQEEEQSEKTNEVGGQEDKEEVQTESEGASQDIQEETKDEDNANEAAEFNTESKDEDMSKSKEPETHTETLDSGNTDNKDITLMGNDVPETDKESAIEKEGSVLHTENDTETGAGDTERQRDADDAHQNIERRSDGQPDRDERDQADEAGDDRSSGEKVQETDGKVDVEELFSQAENGEKSSEVEDKTKDGLEKVEENKVEVDEVVENLEGEVKHEDPGTEEARKAMNGEIQAGEKENDLEGGDDSKTDDEEKKDSAERDEDDVNVGQEAREDEGQFGYSGDTENVLEDGKDLNVENTEKKGDAEREEDGENDQQKDVEQVRDNLSVVPEEEIEENKQNDEDEIVGEKTEKVKDKETEDGNKEEEIEAEVENVKGNAMVEVDESSAVNEAKDTGQENEFETGEMLVEDLKCEGDEAEKKVAYRYKITDNPKKEKEGDEEAISGENLAQKPDYDLTEDQNTESVSQEEQMELGSSGVKKDDMEPSMKEKEGEHLTAEVNNDLLASNIDAENGEPRNASPEEFRKVEEHLQDEETQKSEPETDKEIPEEEKDDEKEQEKENSDMTDVEAVPSERDSQLGAEQKSDKGDDKSMSEKAEKESEISATTFIENVAPEETLDLHDIQKVANKYADSDIFASEEAEVSADEPNYIESEPKSTNNELKSRDASEGKDKKLEEPSGKKRNSLSEKEGGSSISHSVELQPVEKVLALKKEEKDPVMSVDSEDLDIRPAALAKGDGVDLVSNWINIHQASKYFETFIKPLDDIKEGLILDETEKSSNGEALDATDTAPSTYFGSLEETSKSGDDIETPLRNELNENTEPYTLVKRFKAEVLEADAQSNHSKDSIHGSAKDEGVKEGGTIRGSLVTTLSSNDDDTNQKEMVRQGAASTNNVGNLVTSADTTNNIQDGDPSETEQQDLSRNSEGSEQNKQDEITYLSSISQTEEAAETMESSEHNLKSEHVPQLEYIEPQSPTITVITDHTVVNKCENGSQDDTASVDLHSKQSDGSRNADGNRRTKVIDSHFKQTLSRDSLSTFSLDDSKLFGPTGYPRLTTAHTDNSY
ncbi:glutamate-rich protein 3 [Myxocyprinus asiaticus]|uniref:glutamate-rich protein 3 n=1 Tax=Myxocyprinus asiaticus TaxID=70543 RepID=UPI002222644A|nr:glutamate-rich protein 3 [Myxocyprinus asiaticus]